LEIVTDPADGLPALMVKASYVEKHGLLEKYVAATHGARRMYRGKRKTCYVELHGGPGRVTRDKNVFTDGSPLIAWREAVRSGDPYSDMLVADSDVAFVHACHSRLKDLQAPVDSKAGPAFDTAAWAAGKMDRYGLHLVFLDPFNLAALPFAVFKPFFSLKRVDFIVHFSANDLQRNLDSYLDKETSIMDAFAPGWRDHVTMRSRDTMRGNAFWYWVSLFEREQFKLAHERVLVRGPTNAPLYWLLNLSRHPLAGKIWDDVVEKPPQSDLFR